jgi:hypothetical protein
LTVTFTPSDGANYTAATKSVAIDVVPGASVTSLTSSVSSPALVGIAMTWTAQASGGIGPLQYQFWRFDSTAGVWVVVQDFSAANTYTWTPGGADVGGHAFHVRVRSAAATTAFEGYKDVTGFQVIASTPPAIVSVTASPVLPAVTGVTYTWTAVASGGVAPLTFQFWRYDATGGWRMVQDYTPAATYRWTPATSDTGVHALHVRVRNANSTATYDAYLDTVSFQVIPPATLASVTADVALPVTYGTPITWTAVASGGVAPVQYQFWRYDTAVGAWRMVRDYSAVATYSWTPGVSDVGTHALHVRARSASSPQVYDSYIDPGPFEIVVGNRASLQSVTPDRVLPAAVGTPIQWTAVASGGTGPLQFEFWRYDAATGWQRVQSYGPAAVYSWTPGGGDVGVHALHVRVRSAGSLAIYESYVDTTGFTITP